MKLIRDPIHGYIELNELMIKIVDTPQVQRLRRVKQLGFSNLVYPGANHTRFEHSLGTMYLAGLSVSELEDELMKDEMMIAGLLHDVAHPPLSHASEGILMRYLGKNHEKIAKKITGGALSEILDMYGLSIRRVLDHITGKSKERLISGDIDVDRMDYLVRDSYYTGVAYGLFDHLRLLRKMKYHNGEFVIEYEGIKAAESMLISRYFMYPTVYFHHVTRIAKKMYELALKYCIEDHDLKPMELLKMDDYDIMCYLRERDGIPGEIARRLDERRLYKRALYVGADRVDMDWCLRQNPERLAEEISMEGDVEEGSVLVDIPEIEEVKEFRAKVMMEDGIKTLEDVSTMPEFLRKGQVETWRVGVYCPAEYMDKIGKIASRLFNVKRFPRQARLDEVVIE